MPAGKSIRVRGARVHNLKNVDVDVPVGRLTAITGVSGSGKSSLAFDTLYAEGQRRYLETFTAYSRQFLERMEKPDADRIEGIPASVAVAQTAPRRSSRTTVGSMTEIDDHLAVLFARLGKVNCRKCSAPIEPASVSNVSAWVDELPERTRYMIAFPLELLPGTNLALLADSLRESGFLRLRIGSSMHVLEDGPIPDPGESPEADVIVDRLVRGSDAIERREDSIRTAFERGFGRCRILTDEASPLFHQDWVCPHCSTPHIAPEPALFRTNSPVGACPACEGFGRVIDIDYDRVIPDPGLTLSQGAIAPFRTPAYQEMQESLEKHGPALGLRIDVPWRELTDTERALAIEGRKSKGLYGIRDLFAWLEKKSYKMHVRVFLSRWRAYRPCETCGGDRLRPESLAVRLGGSTFAEMSNLTLDQAKERIESVAADHVGHPAAERAIRPILARLGYLIDVGLGYLTLARPARTLSGGEAQRVGLTTALGSGLVNMLYVLDEPTAGLHPQDVDRLIALVHALRDRGNTVIAVEHDLDFVRKTDYLVDLGPGAGENGGEVLFQGPIAEAIVATQVDRSRTLPLLQPAHSRNQAEMPRRVRPVDKGSIRLIGASGIHLKNVDVSLPSGAFTVIAGVSGAGKTTLLRDTIYPAVAQDLGQECDRPEPFDRLEFEGPKPREAVLVDSSAIGRSSRSNPATFLKIMDEIRKVFAETPDAKARKFGAGRFSFNNEEGRCSTCEGNGFTTVEMQFLADVTLTCPDCHGARFKPEVLEVTYRGKSIADVLNMTGREAWSFFRTKSNVQNRLRQLMDVGLDYLRLGQSTSTLSGGEAQRLKLAARLASAGEAVPGSAKAGQLILMDEPTAGLHPSDIATLRQALDSLVDRGHTLVVVENDLDIIRHADWLIELGPGAGDAGGNVIFQGRPADSKGRDTPTGKALNVV
ncbi:excinuclease ABC subunit A [bacterium]|nr:excinuclease ABC subunit A [bacterium]